MKVNTTKPTFFRHNQVDTEYDSPPLKFHCTALSDEPRLLGDGAVQVYSSQAVIF